MLHENKIERNKYPILRPDKFRPPGKIYTGVNIHYPVTIRVEKR
jgi:hypothetical protein